jgi:hypothetical protein
MLLRKPGLRLWVSWRSEMGYRELFYINISLWDLFYLVIFSASLRAILNFIPNFFPLLSPGKRS